MKAPITTSICPVDPEHGPLDGVKQPQTSGFCRECGRIAQEQEDKRRKDAQAMVFVVGAGQGGCLYDYGPNYHTSRKAAWVDIKAELESLGDYGQGLTRRTLGRIARDLFRDGIHRFERRLRPFVGWDYVEITVHQADTLGR